MTFTSFTFFVFFVILFIIYWSVSKFKVSLQNWILLFGGYIFYAWADYRFLSILIGCSLINFFLGIFIEKTKHDRLRTALVTIGIIQGVGGLAYFKYFNFFITSFKELLSVFGIQSNLKTLNIIIPVGISFFTFRTLSYILDIKNGKINPTRDVIVFLNYVSFFPSILSGPIDKARSFIPQLEKKRVFIYANMLDGLRQILWGMFKKLVIADYCTLITDEIFNNYTHLPHSTLFLGAFIYTIQVYIDFSGYSDMAIGFARLLGFEISKNFDYPFFAQNIADFWRRWHISLTSWLTEYVFTPLSIAFRNYNNAGLILAILINLTIVGIWHGARWNNVLYGFLHGCYFIPLILLGTMNKKVKLQKDKIFPSIKELLNMISTFTVVMLTFIIFRADTIGDAFLYLSKMFSSIFSKNNYVATLNYFFWEIGLVLPFYIALVFVTEWVGRFNQYGLACVEKIKFPLVRWSVYVFLIFSIAFFTRTNQTPFIYLQF
jgi:alginate O-acetyltransferase complex protein AlgI